MNRSKPLAISLLGLSAAALFAVTSAGAATASPTTPNNGASQVSSHQTGATDAAAYWTGDRMKSAISGDVIAAKALQRGNRSAAEDVVKGAPTSVPGTVVPGAIPGTLLDKSADTTASATAKKPVLQAASETPVKTIGKVFFTLAGSNYVCSGNSVSSSNRSVVSTAGHCVNEGPGAFATNWVFVPAYNNGSAPYGKWTAKALYTPSQWSGSGNMQYDTGFAVMNTLNGKKLADVVGSSGIQFNQARGLTYKSFGYPAASPFNGETLKSCTGTATNDTINPQFNSQGIPCNMTGGSSGGPWFIGTSSTGYQNSINSYGYGTNSTKMFGPYWGSVIQSTYSSASAAA
ncbi:trypsin-like serine peptidase [Pseudarthrobacter sp. J1763]|uniref:trypsin-like serine peptidase n=1 Tax=Pseudarthrobacter sp. J1763 TaxID=3420445 RepID=UPI003D2AA1B7